MLHYTYISTVLSWLLHINEALVHISKRVHQGQGQEKGDSEDKTTAPDNSRSSTAYAKEKDKPDRDNQEFYIPRWKCYKQYWIANESGMRKKWTDVYFWHEIWIWNGTLFATQ